MCRILVPVDGSDNGRRALALAIGLAGKLAGASVHLVHVRVPQESLAVEAVDAGCPRAAPEDVLPPARAMLEEAGVPFTSEGAEGYVGSTIAAQAAKHACDAIVMGTRGMGSAGELLGSIARQVIQFAEVPVTLVK